MNPQDVLILAAELGIGLAGFASLSAALRSRSSRAHSRFQSARVSTLVLTSLGVSFFAYVPMVLDLALGDPALTWRISSGLCGAWQFLTLVEHLRSAPTFRTQPDFSPFAVGLATLAFALAAGLNAWNASTLGTAWPFLTSLACGLLVAGSRFAQLVASLWTDEEETD